MTNGDREFVVVLRGMGGTRFEPDERLQLAGFPTAYSTADVNFRTLWRDEGHGSPVPRGLWVEVRAEAPSLDDAVPNFTNLANFLGSFVSLATNASVGVLNAELAFDNTPDVEEHAFLQRFRPGNRGLPTPGRKVPVDIAGRLAQLVTEHGEAERLSRAAVHYRHALRNWSSGKELLALMFLYMGMEALEPVARRDHDLSELELARKWDIVPEDVTTLDGDDRYTLQSKVRLKLLFSGDEDTYEAAKEARNGLSHAYMEFDEVRERAKKAKNKTAKYLRSAIFPLCKISCVTRLGREEPGQMKNGPRPLRLEGKPASNPLDRGGNRDPRGRKSGAGGLGAIGAGLGRGPAG